MASLQNTEGFEFIGYDDEATPILCIVKKDPAGMHSVYDINGEPCFMRLVGWDSLQSRASQRR